MSEGESHNTFISWSGDRSRRIAALLHSWLPNITDSIQPWMSSDDIAKGSSWKSEIQRKLASCSTGIIVLTPENKDAPWILFESGAIYKALETTRTCTLLCNLSPPLPGPLGEFQATEFTKDDFCRMVIDIVKHIDPSANEERISKRFDKFWDDLSRDAIQILGLKPSTEAIPKDRSEIMFEEVLSAIRSLNRRQDQIEDFIDEYSSNNFLSLGKKSPQINLLSQFELVWAEGADKDIDYHGVRSRAYFEKLILDFAASMTRHVGRSMSFYEFSKGGLKFNVGIKRTDGGRIRVDLISVSETSAD